MDLFTTQGFTSSGTAPANGHNQGPSGSNSHDSPNLDDQPSNVIGGTDDGVGSPNSDHDFRSKASMHGLSVDERKERQKQQNRRAAERSRNKKREELTALELTVNNIQDENQRLRARLSSLISAKSIEQAQPIGETDPSIQTDSSGGIDYSHLAKLQLELGTVKASLMTKEMELARLRGIDAQSDESEGIRHVLLSQTGMLQMVRSEVKALHLTINHLRSERDSLARQRDILSREIEGRRTLRESIDEPTGSATTTRVVGVERALLELRRLVDDVIKSWEQGSIVGSGSVGGPARVTNDESEIDK